MLVDVGSLCDVVRDLEDVAERTLSTAACSSHWSVVRHLVHALRLFFVLSPLQKLRGTATDGRPLLRGTRSCSSIGESWSTLSAAKSINCITDVYL